MKSRRDPGRLVGGVLLAGTLLAGAACRQDMHDTPRFEPLEASDFFADGSSARMPPEGTVARGGLQEDEAFYTGRLAGQNVAELPVPLTRDLVERGQERFNIYCAPCHGRTGDGRGMVVRRGFRQPASFHEARLRAMPIGYFVDVMRNGFGQMPTYRTQVGPRDRWAIAAYIRALQLSRTVNIDELAPEERQALEDGQPSGAEEGAAAHE